MAWLLTLPGAPLVYYGDEYGQWGGADPNNRLIWRPEASLTANEAAMLAWTRKLGAARRNVRALRRGDYTSLTATEDTLAFGRIVAKGDAAIVGLTRASTPQAVSVDASSALGFAAGTVLHDALGGPDVTVSAGKASFTVPAGGAVILSP